jgi:pilus assembly protein CpaF
MSGRFSMRRVAAPHLAPEQPVPEMAFASAPATEEPQPANALHSEKVLDAKVRLHRRLIEEINLSAMEKLPADEVRGEVHGLVAKYVVAERLAINGRELEEFVSEILDEMMGLGPLEPLLKDPTISDILINGHESIFVERRGILEPLAARFKDEAHLATRACSTVRASTSRCGRSVSMARWFRSESFPRSRSVSTSWSRSARFARKWANCSAPP